MMSDSPRTAAQDQRIQTLFGFHGTRSGGQPAENVAGGQAPPAVVQTETGCSSAQMQAKIGGDGASRVVPAAKRNATGLPDNIKSGIEAMSGMSMDNVRVHYNSPQPAQLNAHALAQGTDIHVAPGQERHLPHEAWHVVQQAQGRVKPTTQMAGVDVNDNAMLEREADVAGSRALQSSLAGRGSEMPDSASALAQLRYLRPVQRRRHAHTGFYTTMRQAVQLAKAQWVNPAPSVAISGKRGALVPAGYTAKPAAAGVVNDYIKGTHYDGPHATPMGELINQLNAHYQGQNTGLAPPHDKVPQLTGNKTMLGSPVNATYRRPFEVKARTSVARGKGRSNNSGIETAIGCMGRDEARIKGKSALFQGGHLVGDNIMDSHGSFLLYEDWNLAPQHANFNSPIYLTTMENAAARAVTAGADLEYTVNLQYPDGTYTVQASALAAGGIFFGGFGAGKHYGQFLDAAIRGKHAPDQPITFTRRTPGYWRATMKDLNAGQHIQSTVRDDLSGAYDGTLAGVDPQQDYQPPFLETFKYTAKADNAVLGPLAQGKQWDVDKADELTLTTRQETY